MAPSSGGAAHDYMHKLKYILDTTPELSLPKVPAFTQVPYFTVWVDGKKSMLRFPYAEGNHFVTELRHAVMREFRYRGAPIDAHVTNGTGLSGRDCFLCSHVWRQGSRYGVCFSVALKQPLSHPAPDAFCDVGTARDGSKHWDNRTMSDDAAAGDCSSSSCSPPLEEGTHNPSGSADDGRGLLVCEHPSVDTVAQAFESSALRLCAARPTCAAASRSGSATALQDSSLFAGGGQFFYDAETTQDFQCPEHVELIQDNHIAGGSSTLADTSCVEHDTRSRQFVRSGGQIFLDGELLQDYHTCVSVGSDAYHQETIKTRAGQRSAAVDNDQDTKKTREGQRSVSTASPPPETHWSKEENKEAERPFPRLTPPSARSGLPGPLRVLAMAPGVVAARSSTTSMASTGTHLGRTALMKEVMVCRS